MTIVQLKIDNLLLDDRNPRTGRSDSQHEAMQKIVDEQGGKLLKLAEDIVEHGVSPIDLLYIFKDRARPEHYVVVEGNRRLAALKLLSNPHHLDRVKMPSTREKRFRELAARFNRKSIEPLNCVEAAKRSTTNHWIELRHTGQNEGAGVVPWETLQRERFSGDHRTADAFEFVGRCGNLTQSDRQLVDENLNGSTLGRFVKSPQVQKFLGLELRGNKLQAVIAPREVLKPLKRLVLDIAKGEVNSRKHNTVSDMLGYLESLPKKYHPDHAKQIKPKQLDEIGAKDLEVRVPAVRVRSTVKDPIKRPTIVPRQIPFKVSDGKPAKILYELSRLKVDDFRFAGGVLFRVFLELSVDHYMARNKLAQKKAIHAGRDRYLTLKEKLNTVIDHLVSAGHDRKQFKTITIAVNKPHHPLSVEQLHDYVHNRFVTPDVVDLKNAWDDAVGFFEAVWADQQP